MRLGFVENEDMRRLLTWNVTLISLMFFSAMALAKVEVKTVAPEEGMEEASGSLPAELPAEPRSSTKKTGRERAQQYFQRKSASQPVGADDHYLALHLGGFLDSDSYKWGWSSKSSGEAKSSIGVTYRVGEWVNSMDFLARIDFNTYDLKEGRATKMSLLPLITFPDATSRFPLYFGAGAGLGIFFKQVPDESNLSLDYQLVAGARVFNLFETAGFFGEVGYKNHIHLLSDGQLNGITMALGAVFTF